jgi:hypothetical protein
VVVAVLLVVVYHQALTVNQRLLLQLLWLLMMGMRIPETCCVVIKRQLINLRICCIWLVDSVESMMMRGLANPKKSLLILKIIYNFTKAHLRKHSTRAKVRILITFRQN